MKLKDIIPNPNNPRTVSQDKLQKLISSIKDFPKMMELRPIIIDDNNIILGGNMRYKALKKLKYREIPDNWIKKASELSEDEKRRFIIADNVGFGEWDCELLAVDWDKDELEEWGLEVNFGEEEELGAKEDDYTEPDNLKVDVVHGDLIEFVCDDGRVHRLLCGDSTSVDGVEKLMDGKKADIAVTDPPYNVGYTGKTRDQLTIQNDKMDGIDFLDFLKCFFSCAFLFMKEGSPIYVFGPLEDGAFLNGFLGSGFKLQSILIWVKNSAVMGRKDYNYKHEPILYGWKEGSAHKWYGDFNKSTIIECDNPSRNGEHPTMKPIALLNELLNNSSKPMDMALDLFLGSGSTLVAAHQLNRICYGMELDPKYCQVIIDRMHKLDESITVKINGKEYAKSKMPF